MLSCFSQVWPKPITPSKRYSSDGIRFCEQEIKLQLTNFPRLTDLSDPSQVSVKFGGETISVRRIESSSYSGTVVSFNTGTSLTATETIQVYYTPSGLARAGGFNFVIDPDPSPTILSFFPDKGRALKELSMSATVLYVDPALASSWTVSLSGGPLSVNKALAPTVTQQSATGCEQRHCSKYLVQYKVPSDAIPESGGDVKVVISAGTDSVEIPSFRFDKDDTPSIEALDPTSMSIQDTGSAVVTMYLKNVPATFCSSFSACRVKFGSLGGRPRVGAVIAASYANDLLTVKVRPPRVGAGGTVDVEISDNGGTPIVFNAFGFLAPPAAPVPIDGACSGGETITLEIVGWGAEVRSADAISVLFGDKEGKVDKIISSVAQADYSETVLQITTPILDGMGIYQGVVSYAGKTSSFDFECFDSPIAKATPASATLDGRVLASSDGKTIMLELSNFPALETSADVVVRFGDVVCDGAACSVLSYTNLPDSVSLQITAPAVARSANVFLSATFQGKAAPPKGGDPSKVYIRSKKTAKAAFSHYRPNPVVMSARFCSECSEGRTCIKSGLCKDRVRPKLNALGISGSGVLTVVVDNFPKIPFDARSGAIRAPAMMQLTFGEYFGTINRVLYSDDIRSAFEISLSSPVLAGSALMDLKLFEDADIPVFFSARSDITLFDENVAIACVGPCETAATGESTSSSSGAVLEFYLENIALASAADVIISVGDNLAGDVVFLRQNTTTYLDQGLTRTKLVTHLSASFPPCPLCTFTSGVASVQMSVAFAADGITLASTPFRYFSAPVFASLRFATTGTAIDCTFDQATDRADMSPVDDDCSKILSDSTRAKLGVGARCVWRSNEVLNILLGDAPIVVPNDELAVRPGVLRSSNKKSLKQES